MQTNFEPLTNGIIFEFFDDSTNTRFVNKTSSGIMIAISAKDQANVDRWGIVKQVGPDVKQVKVGEAILIESGYWTPSFEVNGTKLWKTDEDHVLCVSDEAQGIY